MQRSSLCCLMERSLVTGIGLAMGKAFAASGASVILADSDTDLLEEAVNGLRSEGHDALGIPCDVREREKIRAMILNAVETYGRPRRRLQRRRHKLRRPPMFQTGDDEFDAIIDVNLHGVWNCMKAELCQMTAQGSSTIVNCSSMGGMRGSKGRAAYSASKFWIAVLPMIPGHTALMRMPLLA